MAKITTASHTDHNLTPAQLAFVERAIEGIEEFKILTIELPEELGTLPCGLHGPIVGGEPVPEAEAVYQVRGNRTGSSRMVARAPLPTRKISMIVGPHEGQVILYTAYGGPVSPREPFDPGLVGNEAGLAESRAFWAQHALSL